MEDRGAGAEPIAADRARERRAGAGRSPCSALPHGAAPAETGTTTDRYTLVKGCFALESAGGDLIAQTGDGYSATAPSLADAEAFRMQATDLGKYLFYGESQDFLGLERRCR